VTTAGVRFLDHTADVGIDVEAESMAQLLDRAATGMLALLRGEEEATAGDHGPDPDRREDGVALDAVAVRLDAAGPVELLADWLREILFLHEVERLDYVRAELSEASEDRVVGRILARPGGHAVREIKGVTYHELHATRRPDGGWAARVIFDV
jgi:SHS2 domain-containing protein